MPSRSEMPVREVSVCVSCTRTLLRSASEGTVSAFESTHRSLCAQPRARSERTTERVRSQSACIFGSKKMRTSSACSANSSMLSCTGNEYSNSPSTIPGVSMKVISLNVRAREEQICVLSACVAPSAASGARCSKSRSVAGPRSVSRRRPAVTRQMPCVSIATPVVWTCCCTYQLMKELFPALWLPTSSTVNLRRGHGQAIPSCSHSRLRPKSPTGVASGGAGEGAGHSRQGVPTGVLAGVPATLGVRAVRGLKGSAAALGALPV
mmetsp:Transcript_44471/g.110175  ORF Transcript_44471/g.110175 Transcript_44471/m.110175 type:complete len:265 (-) Transcript_44471:551-1345(-)